MLLMPSAPCSLRAPSALDSGTAASSPPLPSVGQPLRGPGASGTCGDRGPFQTQQPLVPQSFSTTPWAPFCIFLLAGLKPP